MTATATLPSIMDSTMLTTWRSCPQKFLCSFCFNLATVEESVDLHFGGAIARGLEVARRAYYTDHLAARDAEAKGINAACLAYGDFSPPEKSAKTWENTLVTMKEYFTNWPLDQDPVRPYQDNAIEYSFALPIPEALRPDGTPWLYGGRLDMLANLDGILYVLDEKTTGQGFGSAWTEQWDIRNQFIGYTWGAQQHGIPVERALIRGISVIKTKIGFISGFAHYPPYMVDRWYQQLVKDLNRITAQFVELQSSGSLDSFDRNLADACFSFFRPCPFKLPCTGQNPAEWLFGSGYRERRWDPLRQNPVVTEPAKVDP